MPLILFFLVALASDSRTQVAHRSIEPPRSTACTLVTRADVEKALGRAVDAGTEEAKSATASTCDYNAKDGMVSIYLGRLPAKPDRKLEIAALKDAMPEGVVREAPAFPNAFYFDLPGAGTQLHIVNGERQHLMISILGFGDLARASSAAEQLARKALGRL